MRQIVWWIQGWLCLRGWHRVRLPAVPKPVNEINCVICGLWIGTRPSPRPRRAEGTRNWALPR